jgi:hypothetical protein
MIEMRTRDQSEQWQPIPWRPRPKMSCRVLKTSTLIGAAQYRSCGSLIQTKSWFKIPVFFRADVTRPEPIVKLSWSVDYCQCWIPGSVSCERFNQDSSRTT